jgi:cytochrome c
MRDHMNTMTTTKVVASLAGALLVLLLGKWVADVLYTTGGEGEAEQAYVIDTGDEDTGDAEATQEVSFADLMANADVGKGAKVFKKCAACHKLSDGDNATGPFLYGVVGRPVASAAGFGYSAAMSEKGGDWTPEALDAFLTKPGADVPGTKMSFSGLKKITDRVNLIAYLDSLDN